MTLRQLLAAVIGIVTAVVCIRLGLWQLERRAERHEHNDRVLARSAAAPVPLPQLGPVSDSLRYRRLTARGRWDFDHEFVLTGRSRDGSPGVHIFTPLIPDGIEQALLVNRGWVYAPDAASVDLARWREAPRVALTGYVDLFPPEAGTGLDPRSTRSPRAWHRLDTAALATTLPYGFEPYYAVLLSDTGATPAGVVDTATPVRLTLPALGGGPHLSYALQWFSFATIALVGAGILIWRDRRPGRQPPA